MNSRLTNERAIEQRGILNTFNQDVLQHDGLGQTPVISQRAFFLSVNQLKNFCKLAVRLKGQSFMSSLTLCPGMTLSIFI